MTSDTDKKRNQRTDLSVKLNQMASTCNYYKPGVVVHVKDDETEPKPPAPAWFMPSTSDVTIHLDAAKLPELNVMIPSRMPAAEHNRQWAVAKGLLWHELAHAKWSGWMQEVKIPKKLRGTVTLFEEMRIENRAVDNSSGAVRNDIRAALPLSIGDTESTPSTRSEAARLWALGFGRALTTVVAESDVAWVDMAARTLLGDDDVDYLTDILQEAVELRMPGRVDRMIELAEAWVEIVGETEHEPCSHEDGEPEDGEEGDAEVDGEDGDPAESEEGEETDEGAVSDVIDGGLDEEEDDDELSDEDMDLIKREVVRMAKGIARSWDAPAELVLADPTEMAAKVFGKARTSKSTRPVKPDKIEHQEVARTSRVLEAMSIPAITKIPAHKVVPPGRLRSREAVRQAAERSNGVLSTAKPWRSTKRTHSHVRPIVVGIATDISGSMKWAEHSVAQFAYVWTHAGQRVGARTAAVTFGNHVEKIAGPGEVMSNVLVRPANGGTERADDALAALDGVLHLSHANNAAKLLIVVSDAMLVIPQETDRVIKRMKTFKDAGTEILWITNDRDHIRPSEVATVVVTKSRYGNAFKDIQDQVLETIIKMTKGN